MQGLLKIVEIPGDKALAELSRLRKEWPATKLFPFIIGTATEVADLQQIIQPPSDGGDAALKQALEFDYWYFWWD
jgi:hypothetical protein